MTRKDYEIIANAINYRLVKSDSVSSNTIEALAKDLSDKFKQDNQSV